MIAVYSRQTSSYFGYIDLNHNILKFSVKTFSSLRTSINHTYFIHNLSLKSTGNSVHDLGFTLICSLYSGKYIEVICCEVSKLLGYIFRISHEIHLIFSLIALMCYLGRSIFKYDFIIWGPITSFRKMMIERMQRKLFWQAAFTLNIQCLPHFILPSNGYYPLATCLIVGTWQTFI